MTIKDAYDKGLIKVGQRIRTNGNGSRGSGPSYKGTVYSIAIDTKDCIKKISIKRDDKQLGGGKDGTWIVRITNNIADIEFLDIKINCIILDKIINGLYKVKIKNDNSIKIIKVNNKAELAIGSGVTVVGDIDSKNSAVLNVLEII